MLTFTELHSRKPQYPVIQSIAITSYATLGARKLIKPSGKFRLSDVHQTPVAIKSKPNYVDRAYDYAFC